MEHATHEATPGRTGASAEYSGIFFARPRTFFRLTPPVRVSSVTWVPNSDAVFSRNRAAVTSGTDEVRDKLATAMILSMDRE